MSIETIYTQWVQMPEGKTIADYEGDLDTSLCLNMSFNVLECTNANWGSLETIKVSLSRLGEDKK